LKLSVKVFNYITSLKTIDYDEVEDEELLRSDVFDYVGKDNKYITQPALVPSRILELSREMNSIKTKKFPDIRLNKGNFILKTYSPEIIFSGYTLNGQVRLPIIGGLFRSSKYMDSYYLILL